jgi:tetratricopeptide (TPR) repeat protein
MKRQAWKEAQEYFYQALELDPENREVADYIQQVDVEKRQEIQRSHEEKESQEKQDKEITRMLWEGERFSYAGDFEKAILVYEKILELDYRNEAAHKGISVLKRQLRDKIEKDITDKQSLKDRIKDMSAMAAKLYASGSYGEALSLCQEVRFYDPENKPVKELQDRIIDEKKREDALREERSKFREEELRAEKEKQEMKKQKQIEEIRTIYKTGLEYFQKNDFERAIEEWEKAEFIQPSNPLIRDEIRRAKIRIKEKEIEEIQAREWKEQKEKQISQALLEGRILLRSGEVEKAVQMWEKAMVFLGSDPRFLKELEKAEVLLHEKQEREEKAGKEKEGERKNLERQIFMANRYFNDGQYEKTIQLLEQALVIDPDNVEIKNGILNAEDKIRELGLTRKAEEPMNGEPHE